MAEAAGAGTLVAGAVNGAEDAATLRAGVVPALLPWEAEECPVLRGRGGPLLGVWRRPLPWCRRWGPLRRQLRILFQVFQTWNCRGHALQTPGLVGRTHSGRVQGTSVGCVRKIRRYSSGRDIVHAW